MLLKLWISKASGKEYKLDILIHNLLFDVYRTTSDKYFTGCPLHIMMIATAYKNEMETCLNSEDMTVRKIDTVNLREKIFERK